MDNSECRRLAIERYAAGELSSEAARAVETHLNSCTGCGARYALIQKDRGEFLRAHPLVISGRPAQLE
jgi:anti-sigma factor RsiW